MQINAFAIRITEKENSLTTLYIECYYSVTSTNNTVGDIWTEHSHKKRKYSNWTTLFLQDAKFKTNYIKIQYFIESLNHRTAVDVELIERKKKTFQWKNPIAIVDSWLHIMHIRDNCKLSKCPGVSSMQDSFWINEFEIWC